MESKENFSVAAIIFLLIATIIYFFLYSPFKSKISDMREETNRLNETKQSVEKFYNAEDPEKIFESTEENISAARESIPKDITSDEVVSEIYSLAKSCGVQINSVQLSEITQSEYTKENFSDKIFQQAIYVKGESKYISLMNFMKKISDGDRLAVLRNISLKMMKNNFVSYELTVEIYSGEI